MAEAGNKEAKPAAAPTEGGEGEAPPKKSRLKMILILVILILFLAGAGGAVGVMFLGLKLPFISSLPPPDGESTAAAPAPAPEKASPPKLPAAKPTFVAVPPIVVNLADGSGRRFIRLSVSVEVSSAEGETAVRENVPKIIDAFQIYLRSQSLESFNSVASLMQVRRDLLVRLNRIDPRIEAKAVLFQDLIIQ